MEKKRIAITGGIGSGKSAVLNVLSSLGYACYSCDEISRNLWQESSYQKELLSLFPSIEKEGRPDKKLLGALVFKDGTALKKLNTFSHPKIMRRLNELMDKDCSELVFAEVPLLFEEGYENEFDYVIVVFRNREARIAATMTRDGLSAEEVTKRIEAQFNYEYLNDNPKYFRLYNDGSFDKIQTNISKILENIMKQ